MGPDRHPRPDHLKVDSSRMNPSLGANCAILLKSDLIYDDVYPPLIYEAGLRIESKLILQSNFSLDHPTLTIFEEEKRN